MIVVGRRGRIGAPVERVWDVVRQVELLPTWLAGVRHAEAEGREGYGQRLRLIGSRTGDGLDRRAEIIAWKPPTLVAWRCVAQRRGGGRGWRPTRPDELHIQLAPDGSDGQETRLDLYAACPVGPLGAVRLRMGAARRWREELDRSVDALAAAFTPSVRRP